MTEAKEEGLTGGEDHGSTQRHEPRYKISRKVPSFVVEHQVEAPDGTWRRATYLLVTSTAQPPLLALPTAIAALGFGGGTVCLVLAGALMMYCMLLLAELHEFGGRRHLTYRELAEYILGRRSKYMVATLQTAVIFGCGVTNLILAGQILQTIYDNFCPGCSKMNQPKWTAVAASVLAVFSQLPDLANIELLTLVTTGFCLCYSTISVVLAIIQGGGRDADYSIAGTEATRVFNALGTGIGVLVFMWGNQVVPEIQATLAPDPATKSTRAAMSRGIQASFAIFFPVYLTVGLVGYWAYGNTVGFLLGMSTHPRWLLTMTGVMAVIQLLVGEQIFEYVLYEPLELWVVRSFPNVRWLHKERLSQQGDGSVVRIPSAINIFITRIAYIAVVTTVAATFPFFNDIMGLIGAAGYTPLCFTVPILMHLVARGKALPKWKFWGNVVLGTLGSVAGVLAAVGSVQSLVVAIMHHDWYS